MKGLFSSLLTTWYLLLAWSRKRKALSSMTIVDLRTLIPIEDVNLKVSQILFVIFADVIADKGTDSSKSGKKI
jgi:hypothetical protein